MEGLFAVFGLVLQGWTELGMSFVEGSISWRFNMLLPILFAGWIMVAIPFVPESPRLAAKAHNVNNNANIFIGGWS